MREDVVRGHQVGPTVSLDDIVAGFWSQELDDRWDASRAGSLGDVRRGLDA